MRAEATVAVVIVSHSPEVARGTASMVRQMVGDSVALGWCGGDADGGLGVDVEAVHRTLEQAWSDAGVAVLVDVGGAEMNAEMAVEMLDEARRGRVAICNAPIVEGAIVAAAQASTGGDLAEVRAAAEAAGG